MEAGYPTRINEYDNYIFSKKELATRAQIQQEQRQLVSSALFGYRTWGVRLTYICIKTSGPIRALWLTNHH